MTLTQAISECVALYYGATKDHGIDDGQWKLALNLFNRKYWLETAAKIGSILTKDSPDTATATDGTLDYSGTNLDPNGVLDLKAVELLFQGRYLKLDYEIPQDRFIYNIAFGQVQVLIPSAWTLLGEKIALLPRVSGSQKLRVSYVPMVGTLSNGTDNLLSGTLSSAGPTALTPFHDLICHEATLMYCPPDKSMGLQAARAELREQWKMFVSSRQRQDGRKIRFVPYE